MLVKLLISDFVVFRVGISVKTANKGVECEVPDLRAYCFLDGLASISEAASGQVNAPGFSIPDVPLVVVFVWYATCMLLVAASVDAPRIAITDVPLAVVTDNVTRCRLRLAASVDAPRIATSDVPLA